MPHGSPLNGGVITVVPGRFLLFPAPAADLPPGCDYANDGPAGQRRFGPGFCAALLADMGAAVVVGLDGARCDSDKPFPRDVRRGRLRRPRPTGRDTPATPRARPRRSPQKRRGC